MRKLDPESKRSLSLAARGRLSRDTVAYLPVEQGPYAEADVTER